MTTHPRVHIARSDVVGSLLRPAYLREARQGCVRDGSAPRSSARWRTTPYLRPLPCRRQPGWMSSVTASCGVSRGWSPSPCARRGPPTHRSQAMSFSRPSLGGSLWKEPDGRRARVWTAATRPFITQPLQVVRDIIAEEYAFLKANVHSRTKFTIPAPSWRGVGAQHGGGIACRCGNR